MNTTYMYLLSREKVHFERKITVFSVGFLSMVNLHVQEPSRAVTVFRECTCMNVH